MPSKSRRDRISAIPSTWPLTIWPPSSSPTFNERSRLTLAPRPPLPERRHCKRLGAEVESDRRTSLQRLDANNGEARARIGDRRPDRNRAGVVGACDPEPPQLARRRNINYLSDVADNSGEHPRPSPARPAMPDNKAFCPLPGPYETLRSHGSYSSLSLSGIPPSVVMAGLAPAIHALPPWVAWHYKYYVISTDYTDRRTFSWMAGSIPGSQSGDGHDEDPKIVDKIRSLCHGFLISRIGRQVGEAARDVSNEKGNRV